MPSNKPVIAVRVSDKQHKLLKELADKDNRSLGNFIENLIINYLKEIEKEKNKKIVIGRDNNGNIF